MKKYRIKKIFEKDEDNFHGMYKNHEIFIEREYNNRWNMEEFYIQVISPDGTYAYDGYYTGSNDIEDAIEDALSGSLLI